MPFCEDEIRKEIENAKDPIEAFVILLARQNDETLKWREEVRENFKALNQMTIPMHKLYSSFPSAWKIIIGCIFGIASIIAAWEFVLKIIKQAIQR